MKFQHTTSLAIQPGIQRLTQAGPAGSPLTIVPGKSPTYLISIQAIVLTWTNLSSAGQTNITQQSGDPNPFVIFQSALDDSIVVPFYSTLAPIGTYGLRATNNVTGGVYSVTAWFTQILP